jgi:hypothetical protein
MAVLGAGEVPLILGSKQHTVLHNDPRPSSDDHKIAFRLFYELGILGGGGTVGTSSLWRMCHHSYCTSI